MPFCHFFCQILNKLFLPYSVIWGNIWYPPEFEQHLLLLLSLNDWKQDKHHVTSGSTGVNLQGQVSIVLSLNISFFLLNILKSLFANRCGNCSRFVCFVKWYKNDRSFRILKFRHNNVGEFSSVADNIRREKWWRKNLQILKFSNLKIIMWENSQI